MFKRFTECHIRLSEQHSRHVYDRKWHMTPCSRGRQSRYKNNVSTEYEDKEGTPVDSGSHGKFHAYLLYI
jgi:hypothetical protein